ncbi:MAG TPA: chemotaxis response regulator protein-glutamate methylesterase, partial [Candidatus Sulfotelmatobacter sp.]|nr:chemotaxis response regulator protein-glutamate methylesterase [Candidatus Sulfotelmatobacter sp.]
MTQEFTPGHTPASSASPSARSRELHVLVIDDSATVRQVLLGVLPEERGFRVTVAADPIIATEKMKKFRPDVILLDLEMPRMDGLTFLQRLMARNPIPVVVCSGLTGPRTESAIRALEMGAVEIITKPKIGIRGFLEESAVLLEDTVRAAAKARLRKPLAPGIHDAKYQTADAVIPLSARFAAGHDSEKIVAIGASTGGTEVLLHILEQMPPDCPGIVTVQHMPEGFTAAFAKRLDGICSIEVREAADGDRLIPGRAYIAPGNRHTLVRRLGSGYFLEVCDGPLVSRHRPSVNVLFRSVAQAAGSNAIGILMTGMGDDGADGLLEMKQADAHTIAQDEATSVVFGMPREAILRGAVNEVLPLSQIPAAIL